jgi:hypothetical protein
MRNINIYDYNKDPYVNTKKINIHSLSEAGKDMYTGPNSHVYNYLPGQLKYNKFKKLEI